LYENNDKAESGLSWGFELESIVLEIIGDADEILEENLLDLLIQRSELQTLLAQFAEFVQKIPELRKKYGSKNKIRRESVRGEIAILLDDITSGEYHGIYQNGAHRKLGKRVEQNGDNQRVFITRLTDEYDMK